ATEESVFGPSQHIRHATYERRPSVSFRAKARSAAVEESPSSQRVIPSEGAKRRSRGIAVVPARHSERRRESAAVEASPSSQRVIPSEGAKRRSRGIAV